MEAKQMLENYISKHPDYWEFENESKEVERLKNLSNNKANDIYYAKLKPCI